jgi:putative ABC transport system ATP-binding protein
VARPRDLQDVAVRLDAVVKTYRQGGAEVRALAGVDLIVRAGEFVSVMGPSGSGKSTMLNVIGGLDVPDAGGVHVGGEALVGLDDDALTTLRLHKVGFVFQTFNLLPTLTAEENVALPLLLQGRSRRAVAPRVEGLLARVGLFDRRRHRPHQLSGGEMQRVAIARALAIEPAVVLADEPTGSLDSQAGDRILALLRETVQELGQTVIMVTHDQRAAASGTRVVVMQDGAIVSDTGGSGDVAPGA